jgi:hypothetical protein
MLASAGFLLIWCIGIVAIFMAIALPFCWREETSDDDGTEEPDDFPEPVDPDMKAWADEVEAMEFDDTYDEADDAGDLCPHCLAPVEQFDHFCPHCNGPITAHASIDPIGQIHATGRAYRRAACSDAAPGKAGLIAIWLIFGPQALGLLLLFVGILFSLDFRPPAHGVFTPDMGSQGTPVTVSVSGISSTDVLSILAAMLILGSILAVYITILVKTTRRYTQARAVNERTRDGT